MLEIVNHIGIEVSEDFRLGTGLWFKACKTPMNYMSRSLEMQWGKVFIRPKYSANSARLFLHKRLAQNYIHISQVVKLKYRYLRRQAKPYKKARQASGSD